MKKLSKSQLKERDVHAAKIDRLRGELAAAMEEFNEEKNRLWEQVDKAQTAYNEALTEVNNWRTDLGSEARGTYDEASEKWQEGDKGEAHLAWVEELETEFDPADIDAPDDLEDLEVATAEDVFDQTPESPEG